MQWRNSSPNRFVFKLLVMSTAVNVCFEDYGYEAALAVYLPDCCKQLEL